MEQLKENTNPAYSPLVQNTLNYIKNHYSDSNLSLKSLAQHMDVNTAYLGRQFALETKEAAAKSEFHNISLNLLVYIPYIV